MALRVPEAPLHPQPPGRPRAAAPAGESNRHGPPPLGEPAARFAVRSETALRHSTADHKARFNTLSLGHIGLLG
jgi:hypothetical protein